MALQALRSVLLFLTLSLPMYAQANFSEALNAFNDGDYVVAERAFRSLAEQGHSPSQVMLGIILQSGLGGVLDRTEAMQWFLRAAEQGNADAQNMVGDHYRLGGIVPKDYIEAGRWYLKAAQQGHANAQFNLGLMHEHGHGEPVDLIAAYAWYNLAASQGLLSARAARTRVEGQLKPWEVAEAQNLSKEFQRTRPDAPSARHSEQQVPAAEMVTAIQAHLAELGYDPGPIDGVPGPQTRRAIRDFQRDAGIDPDGVISTTLAALLSHLSEERCAFHAIRPLVPG
jgi:localization factor PodJL